MPTEQTTISCRNNECHVAETGVCVDGFTLDKCPKLVRHDGTENQTKPDQDVVISGAAGATEVISLASGDYLTISRASTILAAGETRVLAIVGPNYSGKTSLIASLYEGFQKKTPISFQFARSQTLFAFERACHDSRAYSQRSEPETEHTGHSLLPSGVAFYHLGVRDTLRSTITDILLADRTGEEYVAAANSTSESDSLVEVKRADCLTFVVPGDRLLDLTARHNVRSQTEMILQGLTDSGAISRKQRLCFALTKLDLIKAAKAEESTRALKDFSALVNHAKSLFGDRLAEIRSFKVAASPKTTILPHGYGVPALLRYWMLAPIVLPPTNSSSRPTRAMERFSNS